MQMNGEATFFVSAQLSQRKGTGSWHISRKGRKITKKGGDRLKVITAEYMYIWSIGTLTINLYISELRPHIVKSFVS